MDVCKCVCDLPLGMRLPTHSHDAVVLALAFSLVVNRWKV